MGLLSKKKEVVEDVAVRELKYNKIKLQTAIEAMREPIYMSKSNQGHEAFRNMVHKILNIEILSLSEADPSGEDFAYRRGKIDALRGILVTEEKLIAMKRKEKEAKVKGKGADKRSSYINTGKYQAGLSL